MWSRSDGSATNSSLLPSQQTSAPDPAKALPNSGTTCSRLNRNVRLVLIYATMLSMYSSLVSQTPLAAYILLIRPHDYTAVGIATGITGVVSLVVAFPVAALSDRYGRQRLLRVAAIVALLTAAYTAWVITYVKGDTHDFSTDELFYALCGSSAMWGLFMGLHSAPLEALFGDSVESGARSKLYVWRSSLRTLGNVLGPIISIFVFAHGERARASQRSSSHIFCCTPRALPPS